MLQENGKLTQDLKKDIIQTLGRIGPEAKAAVPMLVELLDDPEIDIQF